MLYLKQSTASQAVLIGPFIDDTDGKTAETGLTIANTDIRLSKNGGNMAAKNSGGGTHDEAGWYAITLDATDTATVGRLQISTDVTGALPTWGEFQVVEEDTYTWFFASGAAPDTQVAAIKSTVDNIESGVGIIIQDTNELQTDDVPSLIATAQADLDIITDTDGVILGAAGVDLIWDEPVAGHVAAGSFGATDAAILVDTAEIGTAGVGLTDLGGMSTAMKAEVNAEADTALADYDGPTDAEMIARTLAAGPLAQLTQNLDNCLTGTASGTPTTTTMISGIGVTVDDQFKGRIITFDDDTTTAALQEQSTDITGATAASNTLTFTALTTAPVSGDTFVIT